LIVVERKKDSLLSYIMAMISYSLMQWWWCPFWTRTSRWV